jgi:hypothetical protein
MCKAGGESVNYLLLHCLVAKEIWDMNFSLFGVSWVMPNGVAELHSCWNGRLGHSEASHIWKVLLHYIMCGGAFGVSGTQELSMGMKHPF